MIQMSIISQDEKIIATGAGRESTYLAFENYSFQDGDRIKVAVTDFPVFLWVQVDQSLAPALIYLNQKEWIYTVHQEEEAKQSFPPALFSGIQHYLQVRLATKEEVGCYRNLALNSHDQKEASGGFPHAFANVETRNDSTFFARNAIDGLLANQSHGSFPYQSWGINQRPDAKITIDFGRLIETDKIALVFRGDYPHDSYWEKVTLVFDDGEELQFDTTNDLDRQFFAFPPKITKTVTLKNLIKHQDESPFPALTEFEVYGNEVATHG